jgi:hypothetical protein
MNREFDLPAGPTLVLILIAALTMVCLFDGALEPDVPCAAMAELERYPVYLDGEVLVICEPLTPPELRRVTRLAHTAASTDQVTIVSAGSGR